ncbi:hypothetical protein, partial [Collinsella aerofaciens]|uniref:hypothetical protein n=1 Tax=Collinsella aerofaciens TaxID=74426 RepID=UPI00321A569E
DETPCACIAGCASVTGAINLWRPVKKKHTGIDGGAKKASLKTPAKWFFFGLKHRCSKQPKFKTR